MMTLNEATIQVARKLEKKGKVGIDPAFLAFLMDLLMEFLPVLLDICKETTETAPTACKDMLKGRPFRYWYAARRVRRSVGHRMLRSLSLDASDLLDAMLEVGAAAEPSEVAAIYEEVCVANDNR
jgi:hypothetical protein